MKLVVIESPYAGDVERNLRYVRAAMRDCLLRGEAPFASHALYPAQRVDVVEIGLTRGATTKIDATDREEVAQFKWFANGTPGRFYAARHRRVGGKQETILLHRFLMRAEVGQEVDHRNGDTLDNRRANLRVCTHKQNGRNARTPTHNTSGFKGVGQRGKLWRAYLVDGGKQIHVGSSFATAEDAARAYDVEAVRRFGQYARTNFAPIDVLDDMKPEERKLGMEAGFAWGARADLVAVYGDLGVSKGMEAGVARAVCRGCPVEYRSLPGWP